MLRKKHRRSKILISVRPFVENKTTQLIFRNKDFTRYMREIWGQFHHHFTSSFYARRSQKRKKDSQLKQLFELLGSLYVKASCKHVDEMRPEILEVDAISVGWRARDTFSELTLPIRRFVHVATPPKSQTEMIIKSIFVILLYG